MALKLDTEAGKTALGQNLHCIQFLSVFASDVADVDYMREYAWSLNVCSRYSKIL